MADTTTSIPLTSTPPPETTSGIVTAWIPLATTAPAPFPACWNETFNSDHDTTFDYIPVAFDPSISLRLGSSNITCQPSQVSTWFRHRSPSATHGASATVTSIQPVVCPSEWYTALTTTVRNSVQVTCCPSGYTADPHSDHGYEANCGSSMPPSSTFIYLTNDSFVTTAYSTAVSVAAVAVKGYNSIVAMPATTTQAQSDYSSSTLSSSSISTASSSTDSSNFGSTAQPSSGAQPSGLHGGDVAGIFVGVFAGISLIVAGLFFLRRRRRQQTSDTVNMAGGDTSNYMYKNGQYENVPHSPNHRLSELPTASNTPELPVYTDHDPYRYSHLRGNGVEVHELQ